MAQSFRPDQRVIVKDFGPATVVRETPAGALVRLDDMPDHLLEFPGTQLAPLHETTGAAPPAPMPPARPRESPVGLKKGALAEAGATERRIIEALRFGLVPSDGLEDLTLGFPELQQWVLAHLPCAHGGRALASCIRGLFGTGKSHTMAVIRYLAREEFYLTASVEVDGQGITLSNPMRLLYTLWGTLAGQRFGSATPLLDLYVEAIKAKAAPPMVTRRGLDRVRDNYRTVQLLHDRGLLDGYVDAIDGILSSDDAYTASEVTQTITRETRLSAGMLTLRPVIGRTLKERAGDFVESLVGHAIIAKLAGFTGLVITVDEFEVEESLLPGPAREQLESALDTLAEYLNGQTSYPRAPLAFFISKVGAENNATEAAIRRLTHGDDYVLKPWAPQQQRQLAQRIHAAYRRGYNLEAPFCDRDVDAVERELTPHALDGSSLIRPFIKRYVGRLDSIHGPKAN